MTDNKPLHVQVAEALGWTAYYSKHDYWIVTEPDGTRHEDGYGRPIHKYDPETGEKLQRREWWDEVDSPRYDTDWAFGGPLIAEYGISLEKLSTGWLARLAGNDALSPLEAGPLPAVCCVVITALPLP